MKKSILLLLLPVAFVVASETYIVVENDTLSHIAEQKVKTLPYGKDGSIKKLLFLNPDIKNPDIIYKDQKIVISKDANLEVTPKEDLAINKKVEKEAKEVSSNELKTDFKRIELLNVNYFQPPGTGHSLQVSWLPRLFVFKENWSLSSRLGATLMPESDEDENIFIYSGDLILGYRLNQKFGVEASVGADIWSGDDTYIELGIGVSYDSSDIKFLNRFSDELYMGYSFISGPEDGTNNISIGFRKKL